MFLTLLSGALRIIYCLELGRKGWTALHFTQEGYELQREEATSPRECSRERSKPSLGPASLYLCLYIHFNPTFASFPHHLVFGQRENLGENLGEGGDGSIPPSPSSSSFF